MRYRSITEMMFMTAILSLYLVVFPRATVTKQKGPNKIQKQIAIIAAWPSEWLLTILPCAFDCRSTEWKLDSLKCIWFNHRILVLSAHMWSAPFASVFPVLARLRHRCKWMEKLIKAHLSYVDGIARIADELDFDPVHQSFELLPDISCSRHRPMLNVVLVAPLSGVSCFLPLVVHIQ